MGKEITFQGDTYQLIENEDNTYSLKRYNKKYKMWIILNFQEQTNPELKQTVIDLLSNEYLEKQYAIIDQIA